MRGEYPEFRDWSIAAVRLLQGVVEIEDGRVWNILLSNRAPVEQYVTRLGLQLVIDETEGLAYLKQFSDETMPEGYAAIPKLFRSTRLSFGQTVLSVLLRDALRRFEEEQTRDDRCVVDESDLLDQWKGFFPSQNDEVRQQRELQSTLRKLEELGFVRRFGQEPPSWEVRRILKARLTAEELEHLQLQLQAAVENRERGESPASTQA
ncbi:MAG: DUF4194 domain-containing protein [Planctomycetaceae bacterium]